MPIMGVLEAFKEFLVINVAPTIKLQKANDNNVHDYSLVNPEVHIGWIPPKGFWPEGMDHVIPGLIVGFDEADKDSEADYSIRISAAVYSPGLHKPNELDPTKIEYTPDFQGYKDLINLIDRTVDKLDRNRIIANLVTVNGPIKSGMYTEQQPYPYWFGWIRFSARKNAVQATGQYRQYL